MPAASLKWPYTHDAAGRVRCVYGSIFMIGVLLTVCLLWMTLGDGGSLGSRKEEVLGGGVTTCKQDIAALKEVRQELDSLKIDIADLRHSQQQGEKRKRSGEDNVRGRPSSVAQQLEKEPAATAPTSGGLSEVSPLKKSFGASSASKGSSTSSSSSSRKMHFRGIEMDHGECLGPTTVPSLRMKLPGDKCPLSPHPLTKLNENYPNKIKDVDLNRVKPGNEKYVFSQPSKASPSSSSSVSDAWLKQADRVFGSDSGVSLSAEQWDIFKQLHPLPDEKLAEEGEGEGTASRSSGASRFDFTVDWKALLESELEEGVGAEPSPGMEPVIKELSKRDDTRTTSALNDEGVGNLCPFSKGQGLYRYYEGRMAQDAYSFIKFLYNHMWKKKGWIAMPTAGTALGVLRHHGMYDHDDDLDLFVFPPLKYLLPPTWEERQKWERQHEAHLVQKEHRTTSAPTPVPADETKHDKLMRIMKEEGTVDLLVRNYSWPLTAMDTWRRVYDDFHEAFLEYHHEVHSSSSSPGGGGGTTDDNGEGKEEGKDAGGDTGPYSFQWEEGFITYFHRESHTKLHRGVRFEDYFRVEGKDMRSCALRYDSTNLTDTRKPFWKRGKCEPMHVNICLQAPQFLYEKTDRSRSVGKRSKKGGPASFFTLGSQHAAGTLCKCRFGPSNSKEHFMMCPPDLLSFIGAYYGKEWCIQAGPANTGAHARKFKSWNE